MSATTKNSAAQELGRKRWSGLSAEARSSHAKMAVKAREKKRSRERAAAMARIPEGIAVLLTDAARDDKEAPNAYYKLGYRLAAAQLSQASRNRVIRALERKRRELLNRNGHLRNWQGGVVEATIHAVRTAPSGALALDLAKLASWDGHKASTSLRAIFKDPAIVRLIPHRRHYLFLAGMRAGAAGEAIRYHQPRFQF
jgi:hypothetical protein